MLTLYMSPTCGYSKKVMEAGNKLGITFELKNVNDVLVANELEDRGGKTQTPYLVDDEQLVEMYESDRIIDYLHHRFGEGSVE